MGKIGTYEYPELSIDKAVSYAELLVNEFHKDVQDINEFANRIGHESANSGTFFGKLSDMRKFGLIDKRTYRATARAEIIANPVGNEKQIAIKEMILGIPLFEKLYSRLKTKSPTIEQFKTQLIEITNDRERSSKEAEKIRKIYIGAISYIRENIQEIKDTDDKKQEVKKVAENIMIFQSGDLNISLPKSTANLDVLITLLQNLKKDNSKKE